MEKLFDFKNLFILDMANNHQGDLEHAKEIIRKVGKEVSATGVRAALKFQFRQLDSFIHPDYKDRDDVKHIPRFISTALSKEDYAILTKEVRKAGMVTMSTPFDEESVDLIMDLNIDLIKIASCSATDRPLLEKVVRTGKPVIISTAGLSINKIDRLVSMMEYYHIHFSLMHCVALYPTPEEKLNLNQISLLKERYPEIPIGFSTHEDPNNLNAVAMAYSKGAQLFERHVGLNANGHKLNAYSSTPEQVRAWIDAYKLAVNSCGGEERSPASHDETASLCSLMRGVYAKKAIKKGEIIQRDDVFFAMPLQENQFSSGNWATGMRADQDYSENTPLSQVLTNHKPTREEHIYQIMLQVKGMLNKARIFIGSKSSIEISHHYGLDRIREFGCIIIDCINRDYCKKLLIQLPRQKHPYHYHAKKEETFQLLYGDMELEMEGYRTKLTPGETFLVPVGRWHKFHTLDGAVIEEVSTTHYNDDSFYEDESIAKLPREARKTSIPNWETAVSEGM